MTIKHAAIALLLRFCTLVQAADGNDWRAWTASAKLSEISRVLGNIRSNGCRVKNSPEYFVRQLNDFYQGGATRSIELPQALALVASGAGERWDC